MKRMITAITAFALGTALFTVPAAADENIRVFSNGNEVREGGVIVDGRTLVPVRGVFEYMGYEVDWDTNTKTATLFNKKKDITIILKSGESVFTVNNKVITPDVPQQIVDSRFMLPLRAVGEAVDAKVDWDQYTKTATINEKNNYITIKPVDENDPLITDMPVNEIELS